MVCRRRHGGYGLALRAALRQGARATGLRGSSRWPLSPDASGRECGSERIGRSGGSARYPRTRWALARCGRLRRPGMQHPPVERTRFLSSAISRNRGQLRGALRTVQSVPSHPFPAAGRGDSCPPQLSSPLLPADGCGGSAHPDGWAGVWLRTTGRSGRSRGIPHPLGLARCGPAARGTERPPIGASITSRVPIPATRSSVKGPQETPERLRHPCPAGGQGAGFGPTPKGVMSTVTARIMSAPAPPGIGSGGGVVQADR